MTHFLRKHLIVIFFILAFVFVLTEAVFALPVRLLTWTPSRLAPPSVAPGEETSYEVTFTPTLPVPMVRKLTAALTGAAAELVSSVAIDLPPDTKNTLPGGTSVPVRLSVRIPADTVVGSYPGTLTLRYGEGGLPLLFAPDLDVDLTVSTIPLPPDPGEAGEATIEGIDANTNGVRDDVERFIVFSYPENTPAHANTRNALFQYAEAAQEGLMVAEDKEAARATSEELLRSLGCLRLALGGLDAMDIPQELVQAHMLNTVARTKANSRFNSQLSGKVFDDLSDAELASSCNFPVL